MANDIKIKGIANVKLLKEFQKLFLEITGLYTTFIDTNGEFVTEDRGLREFCLQIAKYKLGKRCWSCNLSACKKVIKIKKPLMYDCFTGLTEIISPIIVGNKVIGAVLTGQIRRPLAKFNKKEIKLNSKNLKNLEIMFKKVPALTEKQLKAVTKILYLLINYIFKIEYEVLIYKQIDEYATRKEEIINKSVEYIKKNYLTGCSLQELANLVSISPYYFSHLFKRETGYTISGYVNKIRLEEAVKLLKNPSLPIKQIAVRVGFNDEFYFNKIFKKIYKITPMKFRNKYFGK